MFQDVRVPVSDFLVDVEREYGALVAARCREMLGTDPANDQRQMTVLKSTLQSVLSDVFQAELQEAARLEDMPFTSYPE